MSLTKDQRKGRALVMLRREGYDTAEIEALVGLSQKQQFDLMFEYRYQSNPARHEEGGAWWSCEKIDNAIIRFATEWGHWPMSREFFRDNQLPSRAVVRYHDSGEHHMCRSPMVQGPKYTGWIRSWRDTYRNVHLESRLDQNHWGRIVLRAKELPIPLILTIPNATQRRAAIEIYGGPRALIEAGGGKLVQQDDFGTLWSLAYSEPDVSDWRSMYVEVVNSTANPDGSFDHYFLRVPPSMQTAKQAVAWTGYFEYIVLETGEKSAEGNKIYESALTLDRVRSDDVARSFDGFVVES